MADRFPIPSIVRAKSSSARSFDAEISFENRFVSSKESNHNGVFGKSDATFSLVRIESIRHIDYNGVLGKGGLAL